MSKLFGAPIFFKVIKNQMLYKNSPGLQTFQEPFHTMKQALSGILH